MDSPPAVLGDRLGYGTRTGALSGESEATIPLPRSELDELSPTQVSQIQTELATELFGFSPMAFTSRVVDLANDVIYNIIDRIEVEVMSKWASPAPEEGGQQQEQQQQQQQQHEKKVEAVQKGVNRLETLLMAAVDIRFDQAEVWLLRNTFRVPLELVPYILLPHHPREGFAAYTTPGEDTGLMKELEGEFEQINVQREELDLIVTVEERLARRVEALKKVKSSLSELLTAGGARDTLSGTSKTLATLVPSYIAECRSLLNASNRKSQASTEKTVSSQQQPWKQSREAYLAWVHARALEASSSQQQGHEDGIETLSRRLGGQGSAPDVRALNQLMSNP